MKVCDSCGGVNVDAARFCNDCGAAFAAPVAERVAEEEIVIETIGDERPVQRFVPRRQAEEKIGAATGEFLSDVGTGTLTILTALARWLFRVARVVFRALGAFLVARFKTAFAPADSWDKIPNFIGWGILGALLWRLPTSVVGIVYAALANDARNRQDYELARRRAESAKNWLIVDLCAGLVVCVFRNLVF